MLAVLSTMGESAEAALRPSVSARSLSRLVGASVGERQKKTPQDLTDCGGRPRKIPYGTFDPGKSSQPQMNADKRGYSMRCLYSPVHQKGE